MSRTAARTSLTAVRGGTWEDFLDYYDEDGQPIDLTGYEGKLQVWPYDQLYGLASTPLLELTTQAGQLVIEAIPGATSTAKNRLRIAQLPPDAFAMLNPANDKKAKYGFAANVWLPGVAPAPDYVLPYAIGTLNVQGTGIH